jgi:CD2 antigen cytoplasmic tail-binding protein 2
MKRRFNKDEDVAALGASKDRSKRTKLTEKNMSVMKHRKFYGEDSMLENDMQEMDNDEGGLLSKEAIQRELEKQYEAKQKRKGSSVSYLKREQIEGEETYSSEENKEEEEEEKEDAIKIEPFHLSKEFEEGTFDKEGMYVYQKDQEEILDNWLEGLDKKEIRKAKEAHERQLQEEEKKERIENEKQINRWSVDEIYQRLLKYMRPSGVETVSQTLKRLAKSANKEEFQAMTELTHRLTTLGIYDIYECSYNDIEYRLQPSSKSTAPTGRIIWEYRWDETQDIYGPFETQAMAQWQYQGYFPETLLVRKIEEGKKGNFVLISSLAPFSSFLTK